MSERKPTAKGLEELPPDGLYEGEPCTCEPECISDCKGYPPACRSQQPKGCTAHQFMYNDFLSSE